MSATKGDVIESFGWLEHQRILFISSFVIGTIGVLLFRYFGFGILVTSLFALSTMTLYMVSGVTKKFVIRPDILGDNLYYLGFLFTLVSMAYSLYSLGIKKSDINAILENFGLAISTTLYGLALRVFFNQTKSDLEGYDTAVRMSLTDAASSLIGEMSTLGRDVATLRLTFTQSINETIAAQKESLAEISKINKSYLNETASAHRESIVNLFQDITDKQNKFLKDGSDRQIQDLNKLNQFILNKQIEIDRIFKNEFENLAKGMYLSINEVAESSKQFSVEAKKLAPSTAKMFKEFDKFSANAEQINNNLIAPLTNVTNAVSESSQNLIEVSKSLQTINKHINEMSSEMPTVLDGMNSKYKLAINSQLQFYESIKDNLNNSVTELKVFGLENQKIITERNLENKAILQDYIDSNINYKSTIDEVMKSFTKLNDQINFLSHEINQLKLNIKNNDESTPQAPILITDSEKIT